MVQLHEKSSHPGIFTIDARAITGQLTLDRANSSLIVHGTEPLREARPEGNCIQGVLHDQTKVSLFDCVHGNSTSGITRGGDRYYTLSIFPHYVIHGAHHLDPTEAVISAIHLSLEDAPVLFSDPEAFGRVIRPEPLMLQIAQLAEREGRNLQVGPHPVLVYYTGKREILSTTTALGRVSASHNLSYATPTARGASLENSIVVSIGFAPSVTFDDANMRAWRLTRYLALLIGRPQNVLRTTVTKESIDGPPEGLTVYSTMAPHREHEESERAPHPAAVLLDPIRNAEMFSAVMAHWFATQGTRADARSRFFASLEKEGSYDVDRMIGAANMFDILPDHALPPPPRIDDEVSAAIEACNAIVRRLPRSPSRDSVLDALGRVGRINLKRKIRHRAQLVVDAIGEELPDLLFVTDEAVNCRNHYVHGTRAICDQEQNFRCVAFLTDTLEFVFAASELIEGGWDARAWAQRRAPKSHPFARYRVNYAENLRGLKALVPQQGR